MIIQTIWVSDSANWDEAWLLSSWDEYSIEQNESGWHDELTKAKDKYAEVRVIPVSVEASDVRKAFEQPEVVGTVVSEPASTPDSNKVIYGVCPKKEVAIPLPSGNFFAFPTAESAEEGCNYVRVVAPDGAELAYWDSQEWQEEPVEVMGAICGAMQDELMDASPVYYQFTEDCKFPPGVQFAAVATRELQKYVFKVQRTECYVADVEIRAEDLDEASRRINEIMEAGKLLFDGEVVEAKERIIGIDVIELEGKSDQ